MWILRNIWTAKWQSRNRRGHRYRAACAETLAAAGAKIVVAARRKEKLESTVSAIREAGGEAIAVSADVTKQEDIDKIVSETISTYGRIDILVSNVGMALPRCHTFDLPGRLAQDFLTRTWTRVFPGPGMRKGNG